MRRLLSAILVAFMLWMSFSGFAQADATMFSLVEPEFTITLQGEWSGISNEFFSDGSDELFGMSWDEWKRECEGNGVILEAIKRDETSYIIVYAVTDNVESDWHKYTEEELTELVEYDKSNMSDEDFRYCFNISYLKGENGAFIIEDYFYSDTGMFVRNAYTQKNNTFYEITFMGYMTDENVYPNEIWDESLYFTDFTYTKIESDLPIVKYVFRGVMLIRTVAVIYGIKRK